MRQKLTLLAIGYIAISAVIVALAHQPHGTTTTQKTDRLAGATSSSHFLAERFAG